MASDDGGESEELSLEVSDPVCGRDVVVTRAAASSDYAGATYYFCSLECQQDFERQPDRYVEPPLHPEPPQS